jgi:hypothetical protein
MRQTTSARSHRSHTTAGTGSVTGHAVGFAVVATAALAFATAPAVALGTPAAVAAVAGVTRTVHKRSGAGTDPPTAGRAETTGGGHATAD